MRRFSLTRRGAPEVPGFLTALGVSYAITVALVLVWPTSGQEMIGRAEVLVLYLLAVNLVALPALGVAQICALVPPLDRQWTQLAVVAVVGAASMSGIASFFTGDVIRSLGWIGIVLAIVLAGRVAAIPLVVAPPTTSAVRSAAA